MNGQFANRVATSRRPPVDVGFLQPRSAPRRFGPCHDVLSYASSSSVLEFTGTQSRPRSSVAADATRRCRTTFCVKLTPMTSTLRTAGLIAALFLVAARRRLGPKSRSARPAAGHCDVLSVRRGRPHARADRPQGDRVRRRGIPRRRHRQRLRLAGARPGGHPDRRRALRHARPRFADPPTSARFSGNVIVEMLNPSNLFDLNLGWAISGRQMARHGDAWVGITAKPVSIATLKTFDPESVRSASPWPIRCHSTTRANCATVATDSARTTENGLVWDIHTQVGAWLRSRSATNPLLYGRGCRRRAPGPAPLRLGLLADRQLSLHLHQRHSSARGEGGWPLDVRRVPDRRGERADAHQPVRAGRFLPPIRGGSSGMPAFRSSAS